MHLLEVVLLQGLDLLLDASQAEVLLLTVVVGTQYHRSHSRLREVAMVQILLRSTAQVR
jgi:hypothetical protein